MTPNPSLLLAMSEQALTVALLRYLLLAGPLFLLGYVTVAPVLRRRRIQHRPLTARQVGRELGLSLSSSTIFAAIDVAVILLSVAGYMKLRVTEPAPPPLLFAANVALLLVLHDAYFYWSHRFMHWAPGFRSVHALHHRSLNPTPFAAFAFHPVEAVIQYGFVPIIALVLPISVYPLLVFGIIMTALNVYGHGGIELSPRSLMRYSIGRVILTPTHHDLHHSSVDYNFGFYCNLWDRYMGTNHPAYEAELERAVSGAERQAVTSTA